MIGSISIEAYSFNDPDPKVDRRYEWRKTGHHDPTVDLIEAGKRTRIQEAQGLDLEKKYFERSVLEVLGCFLRHPGETLTIEFIARELWGDPSSAKGLEHYVTRIRGFLRDGPLDGQPHRFLANVKKQGYKFGPRVKRLSDPLEGLLNERYAFLRDNSFGSELLGYLSASTKKGVYCHDLDTAFILQPVQQGRFEVATGDEALLEFCFQLTIHEEVFKICVGKAIRFSIFFDAEKFADRRTDPEYDFVWQIDLPGDIPPNGRPSDFFKIDHVRIGTGSDGLPCKTERDDADEFVFSINIPEESLTGTPVKLVYQFQTLKAKAFRHISYGSRFLTRGMHVAVSFRDIRVNEVYKSPHFSCLDKLSQEQYRRDNYRAKIAGWLFPRSGVSFIYRYDDDRAVEPGPGRDRNPRGNARSTVGRNEGNRQNV